MSRADAPNGGPPAPDGLARAKRQAGVSAFQALVVLTIGAIIWISWWSAQVNQFGGTRNKGFIEGDPFPWFLVFPILGLGIWLTIRALTAWTRYRNMRRG